MTGHDRRSGTAPPGSHPRSPEPLSVGKRTLVEQISPVSPAAPPAGGTAVHAAAARGVATPSSPLPYADRLQQAFGRHDLSSVRAHLGGDAAAAATAMGARGYASGEDIVFAGPPDLHTAAHEAAHVVQQRGGVQLKRGTGEAGDVHEQHADRVADLVVSGRSVEAVLDQYAPGATATARASGQTGAVQRQLTVGATDYTAEHGRASFISVEVTVNKAMQQINHEVPQHSPLGTELTNNLDGVRAQLTKWIEHQPGKVGLHSHPDFGRKNQDRKYADHADLASGLLGWVKSKPARSREKELAGEVYKNSVLDVYFSSLLHKAALKIHTLNHFGHVSEERRDNMVSELKTGKSLVPGSEGQEIGHYRTFFDRHASSARVGTKIPNGNMLDVLQSPNTYDVKNKVIVFHDLMEYLGNHRDWITPGSGQGLLPEPKDDKKQSTTAIDHTGKRTAATTDRGMAWNPGTNNATRAEGEAGTQLARQHDVPLWAGQSMTTVRVENLAEWLAATKEEKTALAWAIFAFWRQDYDHTSKWAYHTLHEVMDVASNFGVDYNMIHRERGLDMFTLDNLKAHLRERWSSCNKHAYGVTAWLAKHPATDPRHPQIKDDVDNASAHLAEANDRFQAAGELPPDKQVGVAHDLMKLLNLSELCLRHAFHVARQGARTDG